MRKRERERGGERERTDGGGEGNYKTEAGSIWKATTQRREVTDRL